VAGTDIPDDTIISAKTPALRRAAWRSAAAQRRVGEARRLVPAIGRVKGGARGHDLVDLVEDRGVERDVRGAELAVSASCASCSAASSLAWLPGRLMSKRCGIRPALRLAGSSLSLRYRPVSQPPASGLQAITPIAYCWQAGSTSASTPRTSIEYGGCSQTKRSRPRRCATHWASTICDGRKVELPA
jgi:hypothetical protein